MRRGADLLPLARLLARRPILVAKPAADHVWRHIERRSPLSAHCLQSAQRLELSCVVPSVVRATSASTSELAAPGAVQPITVDPTFHESSPVIQGIGEVPISVLWIA
jgi:hypothetical protein